VLGAPRGLAALGAAIAALAAAGCGGGEPAAPGAGADALTVRHLNEDRLVRRDRLDCAGPDMTRCQEIAALLPTLRPAPDELCTEIYGGPQRIAVAGTLDGRPVDLLVTRRNGCEIERYDRLRRVLDG